MQTCTFISITTAPPAAVHSERLLPAPEPGSRNSTQKSLCPATACTSLQAAWRLTQWATVAASPHVSGTPKDPCPLQHLLSPYTSTADAACPVPCLNSRVAHCLRSHSRPAPACPNQQTSLLSNELENHNVSSDLWLPSNLLFLGYPLSALQ